MQHPDPSIVARSAARPRTRLLTAAVLFALSGCVVPAASETYSHSEAAPMRQAALSLASELESKYVFVERGRNYAQAIRQAAAQGRYDTLSQSQFAAVATADLQSVLTDLHLRVIQEPAGQGGPAQGSNPASSMSSVSAALALTPAIGYLKIDRFDGSRQTVDAVDAFMRGHADDEAIILDLRDHSGGGLQEADVIFSYLYAKPTPLLRMALRSDVERVFGGLFPNIPQLPAVSRDADFIVREHTAIPHKQETRLQDVRVIVLTSPNTVSAAEHMVAALKWSDRAMVIGQKTAGANHFGGPLTIAPGLAVWMPSGRTYNIDSGADWEGAGIVPDITVPAAEALPRALAEFGLSEQEVESVLIQARSRLRGS